MENGIGYAIGIFVVGVLFFFSAVAALRWAARSGQLREFDKGSKSIFDEAEPEGEVTDSFPKKADPKS